jgi:hypothetical protein
VPVEAHTMMERSFAKSKPISPSHNGMEQGIIIPFCFVGHITHATNPK